MELRDMELPDVHGRDLPGLGHRFLPSEPSKWNVEDVYEFIRSLPGEECPGVYPQIPSSVVLGRRMSLGVCSRRDLLKDNPKIVVLGRNLFTENPPRYIFE